MRYRCDTDAICKDLVEKWNKFGEPEDVSVEIYPTFMIDEYCYTMALFNPDLLVSSNIVYSDFSISNDEVVISFSLGQS